MVPKVQVYLWLGSIKHKKNYPSGLPPGFQPTNELQNAERPAVPPPPIIHYSEKHVRSLIIFYYLCKCKGQILLVHVFIFVSYHKIAKSQIP